MEAKKMSIITFLPEEILMNCIARVSKQYYPILSQVCKLFRSMVASSDLYARRSLLGCTESCLYVLIETSPNSNIRLFSLLRSNCNNRLVLIPSLPPMPSYGRRYVVVGSKIIVLGGRYNGKPTNDVLAIDCRYDIAEEIGTIPKLVFGPVYNAVVDGKIYVIGGRLRDRTKRTGFLNVWSSNKMMVLDTEAKRWERETSSGLEAGHRLLSCVSVEDNIYIEGSEKKRFVFKPKELKWEEEEYAEELVQYYDSRWEHGCVIDGILYNFDTRERCLIAYDLKQRLFCGVVHGVEGLIKPCKKVCVASCGGNKMILLMRNDDDKSSEIWGAEISLKKRNQKGEIWGNVEWCQLLLVGYTFINCLTVVV